jgi:hypothetical protein
MGNTWVVLAWRPIQGSTTTGYSDVEVYRGEDLLQALMAMLSAGLESGCVKLVWRPDRG